MNPRWEGWAARRMRLTTADGRPSVRAVMYGIAKLDLLNGALLLSSAAVGL